MVKMPYGQKGVRPNEYVITIIRRLVPLKQFLPMPIAGIVDLRVTSVALPTELNRRLPS